MKIHQTLIHKFPQLLFITFIYAVFEITLLVFDEIIPALSCEPWLCYYYLIISWLTRGMLHYTWNAAVAGSMLLVCFPLSFFLYYNSLFINEEELFPLKVGSLEMVPYATFASISSCLATILATSRDEGNGLPIRNKW